MLTIALILAVLTPADTGLRIPRWIEVFAEAEAGPYAVTFCVTKGTIDRADGNLVIDIDSIVPASGGPFRADCLAQPVLYVRPTCELTSRESEQFDRSGAPFLVLLCGGRRYRIGLRPETGRST